MNKRALQASYVLFLVGGIAYLCGSLRLPMGQVETPRSGLFPLLDAIFIMTMSLIQLARSFNAEKARLDQTEPFPKGANLHRVAAVALALIIYALCLRFLGYLICTAGLMAVVVRLLGMRGWVKVALAAIFTALISYCLFVSALEVPLPRGEVLP